MSDTNVVIIEGRLVRDIELKETKSDMEVCNFTLCSNRKIKGEPMATFIDCVAFGKMAIAIAEYRKKGDKVTVVGTLNLDKWESKEGDKRQKHTILCNQVSFGQSYQTKDAVSKEDDEEAI